MFMIWNVPSTVISCFSSGLISTPFLYQVAFWLALDTSPENVAVACSRMLISFSGDVIVTGSSIVNIKRFQYTLYRNTFLYFETWTFEAADKEAGHFISIFWVIG